MTTCLGNCYSPGCRLWCLWWCLFVLSFFPRGVLDEILNLIESVSEDFPSYSSILSCVMKFTIGKTENEVHRNFLMKFKHKLYHIWIGIRFLVCKYNTDIYVIRRRRSFSCIYGKKVKISHSLIAIRAVGVESHCILGTSNEKRIPIYCCVDRQSFPVVGWRSPVSNSQPSGDFLHHYL